MILQRPGQNLGGRSTTLVRENDDGAFLEHSLELGFGLAVVTFVLPLSVYQQFITGNKLIGDAGGALHVATGIAAQVKDEFFQTLTFQRTQRGLELVVGRFREAAHFEVANLVVHHVGGVHRVGRDAVADNVEGHRLFQTRASDEELDLGTALAAQQFIDLGVGGPRPREVFAVDFQKAVAALNPHRFGRPATQRTHYVHGIVVDVKLHPDAVETRL